MKLFSKQNLKKKEKQNDNIYRLLLPSFIAICICTICLSTATWAWFTSTTSTSVSSIKATYNISYKIAKISDNNGEVTLVDTSLINSSVTYTIDDANTYTITLSTIESVTNGYCIVSIYDDEKSDDYYTNIIDAGTTAYTFTIKNAPIGTVITLSPKWGTYDANGKIIIKNGDILNDSSGAAGTSLDMSDDESIEDDVLGGKDQFTTEDVSKDGELTNEDNMSSGSEEENQNIEETEEQNEEPSEESNGSTDENNSTDITNDVNKTLTGEDDTSLNPSPESTETDDSIDGLSED